MLLCHELGVGSITSDLGRRSGGVPFFAWEVDEETCLMFLFEDKALSLGVMDKWVWKLDEIFGYSISSAPYIRLRLAEEGTYVSIYEAFGVLRHYPRQ